MSRRASRWVTPRPPAPPATQVFRKVHATSDLLGGLQTVGFLLNLGVWAGLALHYYREPNTAMTVLFTALYGMQANFLINGM